MPPLANDVPRLIGCAKYIDGFLLANARVFSAAICCWPAEPPTCTGRRRAQTTVRNKIDVVVNVSKAFYDVILTQRQVDILAEDITRLQRSLQDATNQYQSGIVDKTDPQRATIALNNTRAQQKQYRDLVGAKVQTLKQLMGYPPNSVLERIVRYASTGQ